VSNFFRFKSLFDKSVLVKFCHAHAFKSMPSRSKMSAEVLSVKAEAEERNFPAIVSDRNPMLQKFAMLHQNYWNNELWKFLIK
jgi:hypothetical protein